MIKVYKLPDGTNIDHVKQTHGASGIFLNPFQDVNDNWCLSVEEFNSAEFSEVKASNQTLFDNMVLIDYEPKPQTNPFE